MSTDQKVVTKKFYPPADFAHLDALSVLSFNFTVRSLIEHMRQEFDAEQEFRAMQAFHDLWKTHPTIRVPEPQGFKEHEITMEYVPYVRLRDLKGRFKDRFCGVGTCEGVFLWKH